MSSSTLARLFRVQRESRRLAFSFQDSARWPVDFYRAAELVARGVPS